MTTTISKHDLQLQQQLQQQQQHQQQQQQQQLLLLHQPEHTQQQLHLHYTDRQQQQQHIQTQQQQRSSILSKQPTTNKSLLFNNTVNSSLVDNTINIYDLDAATATPANTRTTTAITTTRLDSATAIIQIDSLNNNTTSLSATTTAITTATTPTNNNGTVLIASDATEAEPKVQKRRSLLNFKSFDFHIKSLYSGLRNGNKHSHSQSSSLGGGGDGSGASRSGGPGVCDGTTDNANGSGLLADTPPGCRGGTAINNRMPPYLKIESVDAEEAENLLLDYPQSPYSSRRNSSHEDDNRSSSQLLHINRYDMCSRSQASSPSPYYLSPYAIDSGNMRRSSTSDIMSCKRSGTSSASDSRRPSTSDLLRKARERRGSEARMGRSVSHSGLPRGGPRLGSSGGGGGGRRTSMAF
ncbi:putative mediator of RNA polymerase II transcription subunit 26 [Rhagoletis pomonella]|uniref:putative mediator of RNA polymerase II transcription subunit 26 n=1 Tax=Rhagoletis pomonella TaxID=28610 RepID=UPI00177C2F04|nr:putative mediator of RNA polymerase II transcription subunit 26 [Rhagoletis pomonella]